MVPLRCGTRLTYIKVYHIEFGEPSGTATRRPTNAVKE